MRSVAATGRAPAVKCGPVLFRVRVPSNARDLLVGQVLHGISGNFYVLSVLGMGGMSVVYKAKHLETGKIMAVKTLRMQALADDVTVKRFMREAQTLTYLSHPNIVRIWDYGNTRKGQPFFVMEHLTGKSLADVIKQDGEMSVTRALRLFYKVLDAMEHAHGQGLIHRDLKPGNIMLIRRRDGSDAIKVVDFGIARFEQEAQRLTRMGEVWGSPIYMSPEQCMGTDVDHRTDIYSIGIVMYEALTGAIPFWGKNYVETMSMQISEAPKPFASARPDLTINPRLEKVVMRALRKEPEKRYQKVSEMKKEVADVLEAEGAQLQSGRHQVPQEADLRPSSGAHKAPAQAQKREEMLEEEPVRRTHSRSGSRMRSYDPDELAMRAGDKEGKKGREIGSLIIKVALFGLLVGLGVGVLTMGVRWFDAVRHTREQRIHPKDSEHIKHDGVRTGAENRARPDAGRSGDTPAPVPF